MDTRFDLVQRAQAGDVAAAQTLIERNQAVIYRLVLSLLDDPGEATETVKETFHSALGRLEEYGGNVAFATWLYPIAVEHCRKRLARRRVITRIPPELRALLRLGNPAQQPVEESEPAGKAERMQRAVQQLEDRLRLPLILRYDQGLTVHEMAPMLGQNESRVQRLLKAARQQVRLALGEEAGAAEADAPDQKLSHRKALDLIEDAADHLITDSNAEKLRLHLKDCQACKEASQKLEVFSGDLHAVFQQRWEGQAPPAGGFSGAVKDLRHVRQASRRIGSLVGAGIITLMMVMVIAFLPGLTPLETLSLPETATPSPEPRQRPRSAARPTPAPLKPDPDLLKSIYPGRLAYVPFETMNNHIFTIQPDGSDRQQLTERFSVNTYPAWSPDGSRIAYLAVPDGWGLNQVNVIDSNGENMRAISLPDFPRYSAPSVDWPDSQIIHYPLYGPPHWSPDGNWIASPVWVTPDKSYLALFSPEGGPARYLHAEDIDRWLVSWAADSRSLVYFSRGSGGLWLWHLDQPEIAGENPLRLAGDITWDVGLGLAWSPNSDEIAIMVGSLRDAKIEVSLLIYRKNGEMDRSIPISANMSMRFPLRRANLSWSPDGRYLAFMPVFSSIDRTNSEILLIRPDRNRQQELVQVDEPLNSYTWSPDGKWLAYTVGVEVWAASIDAFERNRDYLAQILASGGYGLSWQRVNPQLP